MDSHPAPALRALQIAAVLEAASLLVLLINLLTVHLRVVTSLTGPIHGTAYLIVIGASLLLPTASRTARLLALIPGLGGALSLRRITRHPVRGGSPPGPQDWDR